MPICTSYLLILLTHAIWRTLYMPWLMKILRFLVIIEVRRAHSSFDKLQVGFSENVFMLVRCWTDLDLCCELSWIKWVGISEHYFDMKTLFLPGSEVCAISGNVTKWYMILNVKVGNLFCEMDSRLSSWRFEETFTKLQT